MSLSVQKVREQDATIDFKATLKPAAYGLELDNWFSKKSKTMRIDGFRPGKVPLSIVKTRYLGDATNSVVNTLIDRAIKEIGKEHKVRIAGQPQVTIEKADSAEGFECLVVVECLPTIELQDFSKINCEELIVEFSDNEIDEYVSNLFERHKGFEKETKSGKAVWGDKAVVVMQLADGSEPLESQDLVLDKENPDESLQQLMQAVIGLSIGEKAETEIVYSDNYPKADMAGKTIKILATLEAVYSPKKFKFDDDFAKEFDCENMAALRTKVLEVHQADQKKLVALFHKRQILDDLNRQYSFALPKSAVDIEFKQIWQRLQKEIDDSKQRGDYEDDINLSEVEVEYREIAERRVKLGLLVSEIAKVHKIELTNEDLQQAILAEAMRQPKHAKEIFDFYTKNSDALQSLSAPLIEDKVVNLVFEKAKKKQSKISHKELSVKLKGVLPGYDGEEQPKVQKTLKKLSKEGNSDGEVAPAKKATKTKGE